MGNSDSAQSAGRVPGSGHLQDSFARPLLRRNAFRWAGGRGEGIFKMLWAAVTNFSLHRCAQVLDLYPDLRDLRGFSGHDPFTGDIDLVRDVGAWLLTCAKDIDSAMGGCLHGSLRGSSWIRPINEGGLGTDCAHAFFKGAVSPSFIPMASRSSGHLLVALRRLLPRFFRQVQLYLVHHSVGLCDARDLRARDFSESEKSARESIVDSCHSNRCSRVAHAMDYLPSASKARHPRALRQAFPDLGAL